jgi:hypothetical protein
MVVGRPIPTRDFPEWKRFMSMVTDGKRKRESNETGTRTGV